MALTALAVARAKAPGKYADKRNGLYLVVSRDGSRKWVVRLQADGRRREFGLGSVTKVSLAEARDKAADIARQVRSGIDPIVERRRRATAGMTFEQAARKLHLELRPSWRNAKHAAQWLSSLERFAFPSIGAIPVAAVDGPMIREALVSIWLKLPETARRVRQRIAAVLDWAHSAGLRATEAPRSVGKGLPKQLGRPKHHRALPWRELPTFMNDLRAFDRAGPAVRAAVEWTILTAARSGETRGAKWREIDFEGRSWNIPAHRMKNRVEHRVPLAPRCLAILKEMAELYGKSPDAFIFPGIRAQLSDMTLMMTLRRLGCPATVHGFRSTFRDWVAEATDYSGEVAEAGLAHSDPNRVRAAYRRSNFFDRRVAMMESWATFCASARPTPNRAECAKIAKPVRRVIPRSEAQLPE